MTDREAIEKLWEALHEAAYEMCAVCQQNHFDYVMYGCGLKCPFRGDPITRDCFVRNWLTTLNETRKYLRGCQRCKKEKE